MRSPAAGSSARASHFHASSVDLIPQAKPHGEIKANHGSVVICSLLAITTMNEADEIAHVMPSALNLTAAVVPHQASAAAVVVRVELKLS